MPDPDPTPTPTPDPTPDPTPAADKTFTQADVDRIVQERVARVKTAPPDDYDDLKAAAAKLAEIEAANLTEAEKAQARIAELEKQAADATVREQETRLRSEIISAASGKLADPSDAVALIDRASLEFDTNGNPTNVAAAITSLLEAKPHLAAGTVQGAIDQGARTNGAEQLSRDELKTMTPEAISKALSEGRLAQVTGAI